MLTSMCKIVLLALTSPQLVGGCVGACMDVKCVFVHMYVCICMGYTVLMSPNKGETATLYGFLQFPCINSVCVWDFQWPIMV